MAGKKTDADKQMTDQHPITPPPELVEKWASMLEYCEEIDLFTDAVRWGADQELEACCEWLCDVDRWKTVADRMRTARRPKPLSAKEQAIFAAAVLQSPDETCSIAEIAQHWHTIRCALDALPDSQ